MTGAATALLAATLIGAPSGRALLEQGIAQYEARDFGQALGSLTAALDARNGRRTRARIHVYVGLIQVEYDQLRDARSSFAEALEHDPRVRLPRRAPKEARSIFGKVRGALRKKAKGKRRRRVQPEPEPEPEPEPDPPTLAPPPALPAPAPPPPPLAPAPPSEAAPSRPNAPAWILTGASAAALLAGTVLGGVSAATAQQAEDEPVAARSRDLYEDAVAQRTGAFVAFGVGAVAGAVAAYLFASE